jgi:hypothetical protein
VQKLFWCFYGRGRVQDIIDQTQFFEKEVGSGRYSFSPTTGAVCRECRQRSEHPFRSNHSAAKALISLAELLVAEAESAKPRETIPQEETDLQIWFLHAFEDPDKRKKILTKGSLKKLKSLNDVAAWTRQVKTEIEREDAELRALAEKEIARSPESLGSGQKDRWRVQLKIRTSSNSIRPKPLKKWNEGIKWIKLRPQQGALAKEELLVELILGDNFPVASLLPLAGHLAFHFIVGINMATWPAPGSADTELVF